MPSFRPLALFDAAEFIDEARLYADCHQHAIEADFQHAVNFLKCYRGSKGTFNSYRREVERLLHWSWQSLAKPLPDLRREDIEQYLHFCQQPSKSWIGTKKATRYTVVQGERIPNPEWRPFVVTISKSQHRKGLRPEKDHFQLSDGTVKEIFAILSSFFNFLLQEEYCYMNPVALIRQKSQYIRRYQGTQKIRRLSDKQWQAVIHITERLATAQPQKHERSLFILSALYGMYLRISELAASERWIPQMQDFQRDAEGHWWFTTIGKGNKYRQIAVSDAMLSSLKRWRHFLGLSMLPTPGDQMPLLPKQRGRGPISSTTYLRELVQFCFDNAIAHMQKAGEQEEAESLLEATVHWLRHTGISDDVKRRPREHVRDDAGHSSSAITDKYIDIELHERHRSARDKPIAQDP